MLPAAYGAVEQREHAPPRRSTINIEPVGNKRHHAELPTRPDTGRHIFFTVALRDRSSKLLLDCVDDLRFAVRETRRRMPFDIIAWVVLPEHVHTVWALPPDDHDYPTRWRMIKTRFSRRARTPGSRSASQMQRGEKGIWQRRFWEHRIRDETDLRTHVDYIHFNPVKHGHCRRVVDWPFSTFHRWMAKGHYPSDWGISEPAIRGQFGE